MLPAKTELGKTKLNTDIYRTINIQILLCFSQHSRKSKDRKVKCDAPGRGATEGEGAGGKGAIVFGWPWRNPCMRLTSLLAAFGNPQMGNSSTRQHTGTPKTEELPLVMIQDGKEELPPPEYADGGKEEPPRKPKQGRHRADATVPVTYDEVQMHLPPPPDIGCFRASKYPALVEAVGPEEAKHLETCALSIQCRVVTPFFSKPYKVVESVVVIRDVDHEKQVASVKELEFQFVQNIAKTRSSYAHAQGKTYDTVDARYQKALADFEAKYNIVHDSKQEPSIAPDLQKPLYKPEVAKRWVEISGNRPGLKTKGQALHYFGYDPEWTYEQFKTVLVDEKKMIDDDAQPIRYLRVTKAHNYWVVLTKEIYNDFIQPGYPGIVCDIQVCN